MGQTVGYTQYELDAERSRELANFEKQQPILKSFPEKDADSSHSPSAVLIWVRRALRPRSGWEHRRLLEMHVAGPRGGLGAQKGDAYWNLLLEEQWRGQLAA